MTLDPNSEFDFDRSLYVMRYNLICSQGHLHRFAIVTDDEFLAVAAEDYFRPIDPDFTLTVVTPDDHGGLFLTECDPI